MTNVYKGQIADCQIKLEFLHLRISAPKE